jgi:hypothetical protein
LDGSFFQAQIFNFLWNNEPYKSLEVFINKIFNIVKCLNPHLIYLYRDNTELTINYLGNDRGEQGLRNIWERDKTRPYYQDKPKGIEGFKQFLRDYADSAKQLYKMLNCKKICIEITKGNWKSYEDGMLSFIGIKNISPPKYLPSNGRYKNKQFNYEIIVSNLSMTDPNGKTRNLTPKNANEYYVECLPIVLNFEEAEQMIISGIQISEHWTTIGMVYKKYTL